MIYKATKDIEAAIKAENWNCQVDAPDDGSSSAVITGFNLKAGISIQIFFISAADNDLAIRVFQFLPVPPGKEAAALQACNRVNRQFRFTKFVANDNGHIGIEMDVAVETANLAKVAIELLMRLLNIADEAYPVFQQAFGNDGAHFVSPNSAERN